MSKAIVNTFKKLDTDTSQNKQDQSSFYDAQNLRLISDEPLSNGALVNYKGTKAKINLGGSCNVIKGYAEVGSTLVLLVYNTDTNDSNICSVVINDDNTLQDALIIYSDSDDPTTKLGFGGVDTIEVIGRFENQYSQKVYFAVPNNPLRVFNIVNRYSSPNNPTVNTLDILPNSSTPIIYYPDDFLISGGTLESGRIQYACRLFNKYGSETTFSTCSNLVSLTSSIANGTSEFKGSDIEVNSGKSVKINIDLQDDNFSNIRIYSIHYKTKDTPVISLVGETSVNSQSFTFVDNGTILDTITLEEFNIFGGKLISAEAIGTKNNILFTANTKELSENIDLDCRAYRFADLMYRGPFDSTIVSWGASETTILMPEKVYDSVYINLTLPGETKDYYLIKSISSDNYTLTFFNKGIPQQGSTITANFDRIRQSIIYESDGSYYIIGEDAVYSHKDSSGLFISSGTNWNIPLTADCINRYNNEFEKASMDSIHPFTYDKNTSGVYGGTGKIVSYEIKVDASFDDSNKLVDNGETIVTSHNISHIIKDTSFKQGETYRIGIVFYDLKGKPYFTNWIGDIRIPYFSGDDNIFKSRYTYVGFESTEENLEMWSKNIYIEFDIDLDNIPVDIKNKISGFQISKVDRSVYDRSVVAQGYSHGGMTYDYPRKKFMLRSIPLAPEAPINSSAETQDLYKYMTQFISPEFNINNGIDITGDYRLNIVKILAQPVVKRRLENSWSPDYYVIYFEPLPSAKTAAKIYYPTTETLLVDNTVVSSEFNNIGLDANVGMSFDINSINKTFISDANGSTTSLSPNNISVKVENRAASDSMNSDRSGDGHGACRSMYAPTGLIIDYNNPIPVVSEDFDFGFIYVFDLYRDNASTRYSGDSYTSRSLNEYSEISDIYSISSTNKAIARGDIYNTVFDTHISMADPKTTDGEFDVLVGSTVDRRHVVGLFPIESSVNCFLTGSKPSKYIYNYPSGRNLESVYIGLVETQVKGIELYGTRYPNIGDLNSYNTAYSANSKYPTFFAKPELFDENQTEQNVIYASEVKVNGEYVDSWSKFLYANSLEVDGMYGAIHKLTTLNNKLFFFQENAIGVAAVKDRYIIGENNSAGQLALGTGGILERYDYVKYNEGVIRPEHVINTITNLYFIDHNRKVLDVVGQEDVSLSISKGVNSLFRSLYKDKNSFVTIGFDPKYREVLFCITNNGIGKTLVYNENINEFGPRSSATPNLFINLSDQLLSFKQSDSSVVGINNYLYRHNSGDSGELYSESIEIDELTVIDGGVFNSVSNNTIDGGDHEPTPSSTIDGNSSRLSNGSVDKNYSDSSISILVNTNTTGVFVADNIEFRTEVRDYGEDESIFNDKAIYSDILNSTLKLGTHDDDLKTVDKIEFQNSYQYKLQNTIVKPDYKDAIAGVVPNTSRRHRSWTTAVPMFMDTTTGNNTRFVDTFLSMKFTFNNRDNKVFKLHDITTYIRPAHK